jgi:UDP-2,4-diacetamido-2,4,6-trideoxy-beta-L-altropyranose hydrolase
MEVSVRRASLGDARFVWEVNNHPSVRAQSVSTAPIPWEAHEGWFARRVADPETFFYIATCDGGAAAVVRFEVRDGEATISVAVSPRFRGKGLGARVIGCATEEFARARPGVRAVAWVRPDNTPSLRAFARAGYERKGSREDGGTALERLERLD